MSWHDNWNNGVKEAKENQDVEFKPLPEGKYTVKINAAIFDEGPSTDPYIYPKIKWEYQIIKDEFEGRRIWQTQTLSEKGCRFIYQNLQKLGFNVDDPRDLMKTLFECIEKKCVINLKHSPNEKNPDKPFNNVYVSSEEALPF